MDSRKNTEAPLESQSALFLPWKVWWYTCHKSYVKMLRTGRVAAQSDQQVGRLGPARPDNAGQADGTSAQQIAPGQLNEKGGAAEHQPAQAGPGGAGEHLHRPWQTAGPAHNTESRSPHYN